MANYVHELLMPYVFRKMEIVYLNNSHWQLELLKIKCIPMYAAFCKDQVPCPVVMSSLVSWISICIMKKTILFR